MRSEKVADYISGWLMDYAKSAAVKGFVVGVSGGIDSAVVSALCAKTGYPTLCVELPIHQEVQQVNRAQAHILDLKKNYPNVTDIQVDLTQTLEQFKSALPHAEQDDTLSLALANSRSRLRMTALYYFAGLYNYLVAGTGNKIEDFGIGFFTKYGDGGVDISPIGDLTKSEVYQLAEILEVDESIRQAVPTDGLFGDCRSDEEQIGASYDELEWAMKMDEIDKKEEDFDAREKEVFKIYKTRNRTNKHKISPIPVCKIPVHLK